MTEQYINVATSSNEHYSSSYSLPMGNNKIVTYQGVKQLYYHDFDTTTGTLTNPTSSAGEITGSHEHYLHQSDITNIRYLSNIGTAFSIPRKKTGTHIEPGTVRLTKGLTSLYIEDQDDYIVTDYFEASNGLNLKDDGKGNLINNINGAHIGNVIYPHGLILVTDPTLTGDTIKDPEVDIQWKSNQPIYTYNYNIRLSDYEFNFTSNPTAQSGSYSVDVEGNKYTALSSGSRFVRQSGVLAANVTGSDFQPYITAVGLYNEANELIAVGKMSQPLPKSAQTEMTIQIKLDL